MSVTAPALPVWRRVTPAWPLLPACALIALGTAPLLSTRALALGSQALLAMRDPADPARLLGPPWLREMIRDFMALGGTGVLVVFIGATLGVSWLAGRRNQTGWFGGGVVGAFVVASLLKHLIARPRPELIPHAAYTFTASFPSGHTVMAAVVWLLIALAIADASGRLLVRWFAIAVALLLALLVGFSRIYMGVHWPGDVLGPVNAMPNVRAVGHLSAGQGRVRKMYVDTWTNDDAAMRANGPGPEGCSAAVTMRRHAPWS